MASTLIGALVLYGLGALLGRDREMGEVLELLRALSEEDGTAVVMVMMASLIPSRRAARLEPGDIIRGTAQ